MENGMGLIGCGLAERYFVLFVFDSSDEEMNG